MSQFHLPAPWSAPQQERFCERCGRPTLHYGRRVATSTDADSDRASGEVIWFCNECGHRPGPASHHAPTDPEAGDDLTQLFDRH